jgi:hypothetical protein
VKHRSRRRFYSSGGISRDGNSVGLVWQTATAVGDFVGLDKAPAESAGTDLDAMRRRDRIVAISEVLTQHADYFDAGAP